MYMLANFDLNLKFPAQGCVAHFLLKEWGLEEMAYLLEPPRQRLMMPTLYPHGWRTCAAPCPTSLDVDRC